ncbi:TPA: phage tail protein [Klebsiella pneumoniae]|uniref:phage tail protein n=1 Tax=Klebsiella pneumoniae TaxID=573 RepID=UPI000808CB69|nr:phage tail protein [Klebsiella pneumoniae]MBC5539982.1 phage tail protein [Klebsiella pneumoniae]QCC81992.1 phage tail protein [Klebsiella pneumoniae]SBX87999.1 Tail fiber protein [Klebsiella pneumoniae]HBT0513931.1 phage tail protein [Klebsiella pneumoniae]HBT0519360.1 phage tail protein [Klebsiella pneumoniae]
MAKYSAILTRIGLERMAAAAITGDPVDFAEMAVGDGSGTLPEPDPERSALVNEVYRSPLNRLVIADKGKNIIRAEMVIPPQVGGFTLREAALYDSAGICLAIASLPESYKPLLAEGAGRVQAVNIWIAVSNTDNVQLTADLSVVMATVAEVEKAKSEGKDYTDQVATAMNTSLETAIKDAIEKAKRDFWEEENPPGTVRFFAQNIDPNEKWPWSQWVYTGENKTIRVGKADGSDVGQTGGSDTVTIQRANLPAVQVDVSGETSEQPRQTLTTEPAGRHKHGGVPSRVNPWEIGGNVSQRFNPANLGETDEAPDHEHYIDIPPHNHDVTGKTASLGDGQAISVVEAHTLLMCWSRVA